MKKRFISAALTLCLCLSSQSVAQASWQEGSLQQGDVLIAEPTPKLNARESAVPSPTEAYQAMIALKEQEALKREQPGRTTSLIRMKRDITIGMAGLLMERGLAQWGV